MKKKSSSNFGKFANKSNAARKEQFRQEKRKWKKEREEFFQKKKSIEGKEARNKKQDKFEIRNPKSEFEQMPLNKFIAHCGISSRRDAAELVKLGNVKVNNETVTEPGHKVSAKDEVKVNGKKVALAKNLVYILLNKPKDYITTTDDPQNRKTVFNLVRIHERIYPVGRLDRNTSGVLLLTNDGDLSQKLTHPSYEVRKVYHVSLDRPLEKNDFDKVLKGVNLEDGLARVDVLAYADSKDRKQLGIEIHSGRNRIVRRIFEHLGYDVKNLDRVMFAGLTKKNVERGKWRFLSEKEVRGLKYFDRG
jgi:23S rRNA pseudouridine2605 synthase